jgi:hypothetical protein
MPADQPASSKRDPERASNIGKGEAADPWSSAAKRLVDDLIGPRRIDVAAEGRLILVRHGEHRHFSGIGMSLPNHGTLPTLWSSRSQVGGPEDVGRSTKPTAEVLQIRQPTSLKVGRVAVAQALARCVPLPLGVIPAALSRTQER